MRDESEIHVEETIVVRRLLNSDRLTTTKFSFVWRIARTPDGRPLRRTVIIGETGEVIDDVWVNDDGTVRAWTRSKPLQAPDRGEAVGVEPVEASSTGADHDMIEHGGDDRLLLRQREASPGLSKLAAVADVPVEGGGFAHP